MIGFLTDVANLSFIIGVLALYSGLTIGGWDNPGWRMLATPLSLLGVFGIGYGVAIFLGPITGLLTVGVFGGVACFALFKMRN